MICWRNHTTRQVSSQLVTLLENFYELHPEFDACPLYLTGESYAGKYISYAGAYIVDNAAEHSKVGGLTG